MNISQLYKSLTRVLLVLLLIAALAPAASSPTARAQDEPGSTIYLPQIFRMPPAAWMGPDGGSVVCLKADPNNANIVYAGTLNTGVYKSVNRGATWTSASAGLGNLFIDSLAVDPKDGSIVYAGTHGSGVYKSVNGGGSWFPVNNGIADDSVVYTIAVNPGNTDLIYAGTRIENTYYHGIMYKSTDGGASWSNVMDFSDDWVYSIAVNPNEPNIILAAVHTGGPVYSDEYGGENTWAESAEPYFSDPYLAERWRKGRAVAFDPRGWNERAYYTSWHDGMVSYSTNNGVGWRMASGDLGDSHIYPNGISVRPDSPDTVYLAAHSSSVAGVLRSTNGGASWSAAGLRGKTVYSVAALAGSDSLLAGTYLDGLYKSDNGGASWYYSMSGIVESNVTGMVFPGGNTIYASTKSGGGVLRSLDGGKTWTVYNTNLGDLNINGLVMHPTKPNILFALTNSAGLRRIDLNAGGGWTPAGAAPLQDAQPVIESEGLFASPPPPDDALAVDGVQPMLPAASDSTADGAADYELMAVSAPVLSMRFAPSNSDTAYLGTNGAGVYRSTDGGLNWTPAGLGGSVVRGVSVRPDNPAVVYAATNQNGVLRFTTNGGGSWQTAALPDASLTIFAVATLPKDPGAVFVGTSSGVYRYDGGWSLVGLWGSQVQVLDYHRSKPDSLFAGTAAGAFRSSSDQRNWVSISSELNSIAISSLNFNPSDPTYIYVGTATHGTAMIYLP